MTMSENAAKVIARYPSAKGSPRRSTMVLHPPQTDWWLVFAGIFLVGLGALMVFSTSAVTAGELHGASTRYIKLHLIHVICGMVVFLVMQRVDPLKFERWARPLFLLALCSLVLVLIPGLGESGGGARRWIGLGPLRFQPGEIMKLIFTIYCAAYISRHYERLTSFAAGVVVPYLVVGTIGALLLMQPDFGTAVVITVVITGQLLVGGIRLRHLALVSVLGAATAVGLIWSSPYRFRRFEAFIDPFHDPANVGYQLIQSLIAVGSGGLTGVGLGAGKQKLFYLPAAHTDFIFAVVAEELGLLGALVTLVLFVIIGWRGLRLAKIHSQSPMISTLITGLTLLIVVPALLNVGVVTGVLPTKGMVLPLVSYGGTAMVVYLATLGLLVRLSRMECR